MAYDTGIEASPGETPEQAVANWLETYDATEIKVSALERIDTHEDGSSSPIRYIEFVNDDISLNVHRARFVGQPVVWVVGGVRECADVTRWPDGKAATE